MEGSPLNIASCNSDLTCESNPICLAKIIAKPITFRDMTVLADRVRARREELGLSQAELAARMPISCSQNVIAKIEVGQTRNPRYLYEIAQALSVSVGWLKGLTDDPTPEKITEKPIPPEYMLVIEALRTAEKKNPKWAAAWRRHLLEIADLVSVDNAADEPKGEKPQD